MTSELEPQTNHGSDVGDILIDHGGDDNDSWPKEVKACTDKRALLNKIIVGLVLVGLIVFIIVDSVTHGFVKGAIEGLLQWIEENPIRGLFVFMAVYFVATVLFVPGSLLTLGSGFVFAESFGLGFGVLLATLAVFVGATLGALVAFILGRYLLRDWVENLTKKYNVFRAIDKALEEKGLRIMILLRLSPIIPFNALNYICGVTSVSFKHYAWANFAILPGTILFVFLGASAGSLVDSGNSGDTPVVTIATIVVGVVFGVIAIALTSRYAKKELNKILEQEKTDETERTDNITDVEDANLQRLDHAKDDSGTEFQLPAAEQLEAS